MRSIPSPELALWTDGEQSTRELRVRVKRPGDASFTNLSAILGGDWALGVQTQGDTPDQPAGQFTVTFLKHASEGTLSPGISAGELNIDASLAFRPIVHPGRSIEVDVRIDAEPWRLWLKGEIEDVEWGGTEVVATCLTLDGVLLATLIEDETTERGADYPGVPVEDEIQDLADDWADAPPTLLVVGTPDFGVGKYTPSGFVGEQARAHAQRMGWDLRYKWSEADSDFRWTLYLPPRDKTVADFLLGVELMVEVPGLRISRQWVRNRIVIHYTDTAGVEQTPVVVEDAASILEYGTRAMIIKELSEGSPIKDSTAATALGTYALGDVGTPLADRRERIPFSFFLELHDLLALQANADHYDYDTEWSIVGISHVVEPEGGWWTDVDLRGGKPAGAFYSWHSRMPSVPPPAGLKPSVVVVIAADLINGTASASISGNGAVLSAHAALSTVSLAAAEAALASATIYNGQSVTPASLGNLLTGLTPGQVIFAAARGFTEVAGGGETSAIAYDRRRFGVGTDGLEDGAITTPKYAPSSVTAAALSAANRQIAAAIAFTPTDHDTVAWAAGTIALADGTAFSIAAGNTGNMGGETWIYLDTAVSSTVLQTTTTMANAIGEGKFQVAYARPIADTGMMAGVVPVGGKPSINADILSGIYLTAIQAVINQLSVLSADIGVATAGSLVSPDGDVEINLESAAGWFIDIKDAGGVVRFRVGHNGTVETRGTVKLIEGLSDNEIEFYESDGTTLIGSIDASSGGGSLGVLFSLATGGYALLYHNTVDGDDYFGVSEHLQIGGTLLHQGSKVGFYNTVPITKPTGVAVTAAGVHAALVSLGLIAP